LGFIGSRNSYSIVPVRAFTALVADLAVEFLVANDEGAVGVHFGKEVGVVDEVGLERSKNNSSWHCE
jgi:hypothetical protein